MSLPLLVGAEKSIAVAVRWTLPDSDEGGFIRFQVALEIDGIIEAGLFLDGGAYAQHRDVNVSFELAVVSSGRHRRLPLVRVEWRSLRGGHSNQRKNGCEGPWAGKRVPETHLHSFEGNWIEAKNRMRRGDLPCAEPIAEELQSFEALRAFVGRHFRINNIDVVPRPDWRYDLFDDNDRDHVV